MFFASKTIAALTQDHQVLRSEFKLLTDTDISLREKRDAFERLIPRLVSHSKREEQVIYSFMKSSIKEDLVQMALEGEEEHSIVDRLVGEMIHEKFSPEKWLAKAKVLGELIEHHVNEEENEVFPALKKGLDEETDEKLCFHYQAHSDDKKYRTPEVETMNRYL